MKILGIETSCDETAAAVWLDDHLGSNQIGSQAVHTSFGGVVPELASRAHVQLILPMTKSALKEAGITKNQLDGLAVTYGPGLAGSLLVGLNFAKAMACALELPFIGINHLEGHLFSNSIFEPGPTPPFLTLIISGGHTQLVHVEKWGKYQILGKTRDDAAGEAFDKVAKMLELPYPGGPAIQDLAQSGDSDYLNFPKAKIKGRLLDFSYSGLKTAVLYHLQSLPPADRVKHRADIAASFQKAAVEVLVEKSIIALKQTQLQQLALAGGVACNAYLRERLQRECEKHKFKLFYPPPVFCTDNGAMIARAGKFYLEKGQTSEFDLSPRPSLSL
ncbi:MAG: tRNA (adenosine(37)-N6)-threonylcarbamoyltransferase complex transferase subunit TsaD [bacterium]